MGSFPFTIARSAPQPLVGFTFAHLSWALPVARVLNDRDIIAFRHPRPEALGHVVLVPKKAIRDLVQLAEPRFATYLSALLAAAPRVTRAQTWTLLANGGTRQDVAQVHFHLLPETILIECDDGDFAHLEESDSGVLHEHSTCPRWGVHVRATPAGVGGAPGVSPVAGLLRGVVSVMKARSLNERWYSVVMQSDGTSAIHLLSG